jgi:5-(carboxyamino)imidazole ribonucleotide mutase
MSQVFVAILMGSDSDLPVMRSTFDTLRKLGIKAEIKVTSAHRTPAETHAYVKDAESRGCAIFICAAGMAAHLAGVIIKGDTGATAGAKLLQAYTATLKTAKEVDGQNYHVAPIRYIPSAIAARA